MTDAVAKIPAGVSIRLAHELTPEERATLYDWGDDVFESREVPLQWRPKELHLIVERDGQPVSHVGLLEHEILVGDTLVTVGGVGSVVTRGDCHRQGLAGYALSQAVQYLRDKLHVPFAVLFCRDAMIPFYERRGWQLLREPVTVEQPNDLHVVMPMHGMIYEFASEQWPAGAVCLKSYPW